MKEKIKKCFRKTLITCATMMMVFTSTFSSLPTVHAAQEKVYFEVNKADEVINEAKRHLGKPYVWGAAGPNSFDCSGFASYVFKQVGLKFNADRFTTNSIESYLDGLGVTSYSYSTNIANPVNTKAGDIILYYDKSGEPIHMGIYMGNGKVIHCAADMPSGPQQQVMISNADALGSKHGTSIVTYRAFRVFPDSGGVRLKKTDEFGNPLSGVSFKLTYPNGTVRNITTDNSGIWDSDVVGAQMQTGTYQYQEVSTKEGYLLDTTVRTFTIKAGVKAEGNVVSVMNKEPSGEIKIVKTNTNGDRVSNTVFSVYANETIKNKAGSKVFYSKDQLVTTVTTSSSGEAVTTKLPLGKYRVLETQAAEGYVLNTQTFNVELAYKDQVTSLVTTSTTIQNEDQKGKLILKKSFDTSLVDGLVGDATLEGNQYALIAKEKITNVAGTIKYYNKDQIVAYKTTDANGEIIWDNLPLGKYYIQEIDPNDSLQLNPNIIDVAINYAGQTVSKTTVNKTTSDKLNMQKIQIFKSGEDFGSSGLYEGLEGVEFTFKLKSEVDKSGWDIAKVYDVITTDKKGNATTKYLPYGVYQVKETKTPAEHTPAPDFLVTIDKNYSFYPADEQIRKVNVNNAPLSAQVRLVKVDDDSGKAVTLNSASFKIKDEHGQYVTQKVGGIKIDTFTTNSKNQIVSIFGKEGEVTLPLKLYAGIYTIEEIKIPTGFLELEAPVKFSIKNIHDMDTDEDQEPLITVKVKNKQPLGSLLIHKTDKETGDPLENVEYSLTAKKDIISVIDGTILYKAGQVVRNGNTNANGEIIIKDLFMGEYQLHETLTREGYVLSEKVEDIIFTKNDNTTKHYEITVDYTNIAPTGEIHLMKTDKVSGDALSGVIYQLTAANDIYSLDGRNTLLYAKGDPVSVDISENGQYMTNELGKVHIGDLPLGQYTLKEVYALDGYVVDDKTYSIDLSYDGSDKTLYTHDLNLTNIAPKGEIHLMKTDKATGEALSGVIYQLTAANDIYSFDGRNTLLYAKGDPVSKDISENGQYMTNELGEVHIGDLPLGQYELKEIYALDGYIADDKVYGIDLSYDGSDKVLYTHELELTNIAPKGEIHLMKTDKASGEALSGVIYQLTAANDIYSLDGRNTLLYAKGDPVSVDISENGQYMTNELGEVHIGDLPLGQYELKEIYALDGYVADDKVYGIDLSYDGSDKVLYTHELKLTNIAPKGEIHLIKADKDSGELLSGVTYELIAKEDIYSLDGRNTLLYEKGDPVSVDISENGLYMTNELGEIHIGDLPLGMYELKEVKALNSHVTDKSIYEIDLSYDYSDRTLYVKTLNLTNIKTTVELSKVDITDGKELPGAKMTLKDEKGNIVETWTSSEESHIMRGLEVGKEYTLIEDTAPLGYVKAESITFTVKDTEEIQKVVMKDDIIKVEISKQDFTTGDELAGAKLQILNDENEVVHEWITNGKKTTFERLPAGNYSLKEIEAPQGFEIAETVKFTVEETAEVQKVVMKDKRKPIETVQTGDKTMLLPIIAVALGAGIAAFVLYRKSKKN